MVDTDVHANTWQGPPTRFGLVGLMAMACLGCSMPHKVAMNSDGSPEYERVSIVYEAHGREGAYFLPASATGLEDVNSSNPGVTWAIAKLRIEYPDPSGDARMASATLELQPVNGAVDQWVRQKSRRGQGFAPIRFASHDENEDIETTRVGVLKFPKHRLDLLLFDLTSSGFFDKDVTRSPEAHLEVRIDKGRTARFWSCEPRLDDFVTLAYQNGIPDAPLVTTPATDHASLTTVEIIGNSN